MPRPQQCGGYRCAERFVGWAAPVVGVVLVHNKHAGFIGDREIEGRREFTGHTIGL
jgi:hypothetical protein